MCLLRSLYICLVLLFVLLMGEPKMNKTRFLFILFILLGNFPPMKRNNFRKWLKPVLNCVLKFCFEFSPNSLRVSRALFRKAPATFNFVRHVMRAILSARPKCSHRCVSLKETTFKAVQILKHTTKNSTEQTPMRTKWFKHIAI